MFSFGTVQSGNDSSHYPSVSNQVPADVPEEYQELVTELQKLGIEEYTIPTYIPDGFQVDTPELYDDMYGFLREENGVQPEIIPVYDLKGNQIGEFKIGG